MKLQIRAYILGFYDLFLSVGAIIAGVMMVRSSSGVFLQYPEEWLSKVPFKSWIVPGILVIIIFGLGNMISAVISFRKSSSKPWLMTSIMGGILLISMIAQVILLGEWYLATLQFLMLSIIQLCLSGFVLIGNIKNKKLLKQTDY